MTDLIGGPAPLEHFDLLLFDLDGVVYIGPSAVPGAPEAIARARAAGVRCTYVTNNASRRPSVVGQHLRDLGVDCTDDDVVTSSQGAAAMLARRFPAGSKVLVVGGDGLTWALEEAGLVPVRELADGPVAVVQGFSPDLGWKHLAEGTYAVNSGLPYFATNMDLTVPTAGGRAPGNGALVGAVVTATGVQPEVAGKPQPTLFQEAVARYGGERPLVIGDRLDTDLEGARAAGIDGLMVLTGVNRARDLLEAPAQQRPSLIVRDLAGLSDPQPAPERVDGGFRVGTVVMRDTLEVAAAGAEPVDGLDVLRAACCVVWERGGAIGAEVAGDVLAALRTHEPDGPWGT